MGSLDGYQLPSTVLITVGAFIIFSGFQTYPHLGDAEYHHSIEPIDRTEVPAEATVYHFTDLSPQAQHAIRTVLGTEDGFVIIYGEANKPPEFTYNSHVWSTYFIEVEGSYYELGTVGDAGDGLEPLAFGAFLVGGAAVIGVGVYAFRRGLTRVPIAVLVGLAAFKGTFVMDLYSLSANTQLVGVLGLLVTLSPAVATWYVLGKLPTLDR